MTTVNLRSAYPQFFRTPEGRNVSIRQMAKALTAIRRNPDGNYPGWNWYPTQGWAILHSFRDGLNDRINKRGEAALKRAGVRR